MENDQVKKIDLVIDYVEYIVSGIVRQPNDIEINAKDVEYKNSDDIKYTVTNINVKVNDDDIKFVLGKGGKIADSIRILVHFFGINCDYPNKIAFRVDTPPKPKNHFYQNHENG